MSSYTKSPKKVLELAHRVGSEVFELYSHESSHRTYTQPQLFACLVLKTYMGLDYRRLHGLLEDYPEIVKTIGMERVPHFTTFQKASERLMRVPRVKQLLNETVSTVGKKKEGTDW